MRILTSLLESPKFYQVFRARVETKGVRNQVLRPELVQLLDGLEESSLLLDPFSFLVIHSNAPCEAQLGIQTERMVGRSLLHWVDERYRDEWARALQVAKRKLQGDDFRFTVPWMGRQGRRFLVEVRVRRILGENGHSELLHLCLLPKAGVENRTWAA